jgi:hypothetical protein
MSDEHNAPVRGRAGQAMSGQRLPTGTAIESVRDAVEGWKGVTTQSHRFGGIEFRIGRRELGHLHRSFADLPFPRQLRDELVAAGRAKPHHVLPDSGWVTVPMRTAAEVDNVIGLFRENYERAMKPSVLAESVDEER